MDWNLNEDERLSYIVSLLEMKVLGGVFNGLCPGLGHSGLCKNGSECVKGHHM